MPAKKTAAASVNVDAVSRDYLDQQATWNQIRALMGGVCTARELLLRLEGHKDDTFCEFKKRAYYFAALPRTIELFSGLLFLKAPAVDVPDSMKPYVDDATLEGTSLERLTGQVVEELFQTGRCAVLPDYPSTNSAIEANGGQPLTLAQTEKLGLRAVAKLYRTEDILFVKKQNVGGAVKITQVRLRETIEDDVDEFTTTCVAAVRVLRLRDGVYTQELWTNRTGGFAVETPEFSPLRDGKPIDYIPITFFSAHDLDSCARRPPLADLADVSVSHLQTATLKEWGEMWTANPTPIFIGVTAGPVDKSGKPAEKATIRLGSSEGICLPPGGDAKFMEFTGAGLSTLKESMEAKETHMARIGARALADDPREAQVADALRIQHSGEQSLLADIAHVVSEGMTRVIKEFALWAKVDLKEDQGIKLNDEFVPPDLTADQIKALIGAVQSGALSSRDLFMIFKKGGLIEPKKTFEEHEDDVKDNIALLPPPAPPKLGSPPAPPAPPVPAAA
jgi:hypothetical protein